MNRLPNLLLLLTALPAVATEVPGGAAPAWAPEQGIVWRLSSEGDWLAAVPAEAGLPVIRLEPVAAGPLSAPRAAADAPMPWCRDRRGLYAFGALAADCALALSDPATARGPVPAARASLGVATPLWQVGVRYETAMVSPLAAVLPWQAAVLSDVAPALGPLPGALGEQALERIGVGGSWQIAPLTRLTMGATASESTWRPVRGGRIDVEAIALRFGIDYGSFSGGLVGRLLRPDARSNPGSDDIWSGLDFGLSWRAPWRAEISVGAQNLIGIRPETSTAQPVLDQITARTPYVRYTQDF